MAVKRVLSSLLLMMSGALTDITNSESKTAFDLAKDAETAALLQHAGKLALVCISTYSSNNCSVL